MRQSKFYSFNANLINGTQVSMEEYKGKVILVVNTASKCSFTSQYEGLEKIYQEYGDKDFIILGFPCNQFGQQDPGDNSEIDKFCKVNYGVTFPVFEKIHVNGNDAHPLFKYLKDELPGFLGRKIKWNFTKFLIDSKGKCIKRYGSITKPESIRSDIEKLLK